jgi:hypothetical protein
VSSASRPHRKGSRLQDWIFAENLQAFVEVLAHLAGYTLYDEEYDWVAIEAGIPETDADEDKWYSYPLLGTHPLALDVARDLGSQVVSIRVRSDAAAPADLPAELAAQLHVLVLLCQSYILTRRGASLVP